ncbi:hypothetical protein [Phaffia rhodozyma]|uniref:Monopolin complex subunit Csm1/Pcs1 C-terminal domain-containing protein n=1 Tax=Phaffia rhodozyma TaxID=264483 RepID=A0A0F7SV10_PHARH|nr:hypothetical protein [Phaffia rhodozyma]
MAKARPPTDSYALPSKLQPSAVKRAKLGQHRDTTKDSLLDDTMNYSQDEEDRDGYGQNQASNTFFSRKRPAQSLATSTSRAKPSANANTCRTDSHHPSSPRASLTYSTTAGGGAKRGRNPTGSTRVVRREREREESIEDEVSRLYRELEELERTLSTVTEEKEAYLKERDAYITQFDALSSKRTTGVEALLEEYKITAESRAQDQYNIIANLEKALLLERQKTANLNALIDRAGKDKDGQPNALPTKAELKLEKKLGELEKRLKEKDKVLIDQAETIKIREKELALTIEQSSKPFATSTNSNSLSASTANKNMNGPFKTDDSEEKSRTIEFYEDISGLQVVNVVSLEGEFGRDTTWNCIFTAQGEDQKSLNFKIRQTTTLDPSGSSSSNRKTILVYTPLHLELESDKTYLRRLGFLAKAPFTIEWSQAGNLFKELQRRTRVREEGDDDEDDDDEDEEQEE